MDDFARLPAADRLPFFNETAVQLGVTSHIVEKDFWVCWILKRLFGIEAFHEHLTFKGGTSLSKVYQVIERFSEDIDVSIERGFLGFGGKNEPEKAPTGNEQRRRIEALQSACKEKVSSELAPALHAAIASELGQREVWSLRADDDQSIFFEYPQTADTLPSSYVARAIKIELGARSDHFPVQPETITPYISRVAQLADAEVLVRVLAAERTFWEKATILHMLSHGTDKPLKPRMSRHYYDVYRMANSPILAKALTESWLLERVAIHKSVFFKAAWARYEDAKLGSLRLIPAQQTQKQLSRDYDAMRQMFFREPPAFSAIIDTLSELEIRINVLQ